MDQPDRRQRALQWIARHPGVRLDVLSEPMVEVLVLKVFPLRPVTKIVLKIRGRIKITSIFNLKCKKPYVKTISVPCLPYLFSLADVGDVNKLLLPRTWTWPLALTG